MTFEQELQKQGHIGSSELAALSTKAAVLAACGRFIRPLARLLLRHGIGYREFADVCKATFVSIASEDFGLRGRRTNLSRITVLTGISRKEVRRLRHENDTTLASGAEYGLGPASLVLRGWFSDKEFCRSNGQPAPLGTRGTESGFSRLVRRYAGDVPPGAVVAELRRVGVVRDCPGPALEPTTKYFMPPNVDGQLFAAGALSIAHLISTIAHNTDPGRRGDRRFERYAWSSNLPRVSVPVFHALVSEKGEELLRFFDDWLARQSITSTSHNSNASVAQEVGVGIYFFETERDDQSGT